MNLKDDILLKSKKYCAIKCACYVIYRKSLKNVGIETVNLYSAFIALALKSLKKKGELVAIIPRSFCNGTYYQPFSEMILNESSIEHIHIFDSRTNAFSDNQVLQENIIIQMYHSNDFTCTYIDNIYKTENNIKYSTEYIIANGKIGT